jgi:hypothetical protein
MNKSQKGNNSRARPVSLTAASDVLAEYSPSPPSYKGISRELSPIQDIPAGWALDTRLRDTVRFRTDLKRTYSSPVSHYSSDLPGPSLITFVELVVDRLKAQ